MLIDIEIVAILVEQLHTDRHVLGAKVFIDLPADSLQKLLNDCSYGGLELHCRHEKDIYDTVALLDDAGCPSQLPHDKMVVTIVVVQGAELHRQFLEYVAATDADRVHESFAPGIKSQILFLDHRV